MLWVAISTNEIEVWKKNLGLNENAGDDVESEDVEGDDVEDDEKSN